MQLEDGREGGWGGACGVHLVTRDQPGFIQLRTKGLYCFDRKFDLDAADYDKKLASRLTMMHFDDGLMIIISSGFFGCVRYKTCERQAVQYTLWLIFPALRIVFTFFTFFFFFFI
jgi:hypothetical protein